jgi:SAM-dependent methyltransferase
MSHETCSLLNGAAADRLYQSRIIQGTEFGGTFHAARHCLGCGRVFFDAPTEDVLAQYYNSSYVAEGAATWYNVDADYAFEKVSARSGEILGIAERFGFDSTHLYHEIGCAFGGTVHELNRRGYATTGTDLSQPAIADGRARGNPNIHAEPDIEFLTGHSIRPNVVYGYHVLEHMPDPLGYLRSLARILADESIVILFVPNAMALLPLSYGFDRYPWFYYPAHLNMFSPGSLTCLAEVCGYELLDLWTTASDIDPARTARVIAGAETTPVTELLRDRMMGAALLHEELAFVLTPAKSPLTRTYHNCVTVARHRSLSHRPFEVEVINRARSTALCHYDLPAQPAVSTEPWVEEEPPVDDLAPRERDALRSLQDEVQRLRQERDALSRAVAWFAQSTGIALPQALPTDGRQADEASGFAGEGTLPPAESAERA